MAFIPNPTILEREGHTERAWDVFSRLFKDRIIYLGTPITDDVANIFVAQLLYLSGDDPDKDIQIYINSPGGSVTAGLTMYDVMQHVKPDISTVCLNASSMGSVLLAAGTKGKRHALPHARILIHQPYGGAAGQAADIEIQAKEIIRMRELLEHILAHHTGQPIEKVSKDTDRDFIMSADEAKEYGLIDEVIVTRELAEVPQAAGVS